MIIIYKNIDSSHYPMIADIYLQGISTGNATFQTSASTWEEWDKSHLMHSRIAAFDGAILLAWAALTPVSSRCVYGGVAEVSVYVSAAARGKGIGQNLLQQLVESSETNEIWMLQSGIFPENLGSINIHEKCDFRIVGFRERIGKMGNVWRNNLLLERRSRVVGID
jgi:phosphinothricin acetyltransferase